MCQVKRRYYNFIAHNLLQYSNRSFDLNLYNIANEVKYPPIISTWTILCFLSVSTKNQYLEFDNFLNAISFVWSREMEFSSFYRFYQMLCQQRFLEYQLADSSLATLIFKVFGWVSHAPTKKFEPFCRFDFQQRFLTKK